MNPNDLQGEAMPRRTFQLAMIYALGAIIGLALAIPTIIYLLVPPRTRQQSGWVDAGDISQLTPDSPVEMSFQQSRVDGWKVVTEKKTAWVVKTPDNKVLPSGRSVPIWAAPITGMKKSRSSPARATRRCFRSTGRVLAGPAPRPLDRYITRIQNNRLQVGALKLSAGSNA